MSEWRIRHAQGWFSLSGDLSQVLSIVIEPVAKEVSLASLQVCLQEALLQAAQEYMADGAGRLFCVPRQREGLQAWSAERNDEILAQLIEQQNSLVAKAQLSRQGKVAVLPTSGQLHFECDDFGLASRGEECVSSLNDGVRLDYVAGVLTQVCFDADWFAACSVEEINLQLKNQLQARRGQCEEVLDLCEQFEFIAASALLAAKRYHPAFGK